MTNQLPTEHRTVGQEFRQVPEDEISLVDIALVLYRRKGVVLGTAILCLVAALGIGVIKGKSYEYSTAISIGSIDDGVLVESPSAVESRLEKAYIPSVLAKLAAAHGEKLEDVKYKINVTVPKNADFVVISSKSKESDAEEVRQALNDLVSQVLAAHKKIIGTKRDALQQQISMLERRKAAYLSSVGTQAKADPVLLDGMDTELATLMTDLRLLTDSSMQFAPTRSIKSAGPSMPLILLLGAVVGLMLGIFAAFFAEFLGKAREQIRAQSAS